MALAALACTAQEPTLVSPTATSAAPVSVLPTGTPSPTAAIEPTVVPTVIVAPPTPTPTPLPTASPVPPTATPQPEPTHTPQPTKPPNPLAGLPGSIELEEQQPEHAARIRELVWVADGVAADEDTTLETLIECAQARPDLFSALLAKPWLHNGINVAEGIVINDLCHRYDFSKLRPLDIVEMQFLDDIAVIDSETIQLLAGLDNSSDVIAKEDFEQIAGLSWVTDGIAPTERATFEELVKCAEHRPDVLNALLEKSWLRDDPTTEAKEIARALCNYARSYPESSPQDFLAMDVLNREAGFTAAELAVFWNLLLCSRQNPDALRSLLQKPLLLDSLVNDKEEIIVNALCYTDGSWLEQVINHPVLSDGLSEEDATILSMAHDLYRIIANWRPQMEIHLAGTGESLLSLTNFEGLATEERAIELPRAGETLLTIIRYQEPETPTMDFLERAIRFNEEYMGRPFPNDWIVLYFDNEDSGVGIAHHGTHIAMREELEISGPEGWGVDLPYVLVHETGHTYAMSAPDWIGEGSANLLVYLTKRKWMGQQAATEYAAWTSPQCYEVANLSELEELNTLPGNPLFTCNYELGVQLFVELHGTLGDEIFQQGFRNMYQKSLQDDTNDDCKGTRLGICHVAAAFKSGVSEEVAEQVDEILSRRYGPLP